MFHVDEMKSSRFSSIERIEQWAEDLNLTDIASEKEKKVEEGREQEKELAEGGHEESSHLEAGTQEEESDEEHSTGACSASSEYLENWLDDLFSSTLAQQLKDEIFIGGTENVQVEDPCPICFKSIGEPRDQHLLRCAYARDEAKQLEKTRSRGASRRERGSKDDKDRGCTPK